MRKQISITCPHCGKLNQRERRYCASCGQPLPAANQPGQEVVAKRLKKRNRVALAILGAFAVAIFVSFVIMANQPLLRTSALNVTPFRVDFFNRAHHKVMSRYLRGNQSDRHYGYAEGTMNVSNALKKKGTAAKYIDSRARYSLVVYSRPQMTFYYNSRRGKFNDWGRCKVAGHPEIKTFRMIKLDSGD